MVKGIEFVAIGKYPRGQKARDGCLRHIKSWCCAFCPPYWSARLRGDCWSIIWVYADSFTVPGLLSSVVWKSKFRVGVVIKNSWGRFI